MLKITEANSKLRKLYEVKAIAPYLSNNKKVYSFSMLSGHSCPFANECYSKVIEIGNRRKIQDGPNTKFRCYSASQEALFPSTYDKRKTNMDTLKTLKSVPSIAAALRSIIPSNCGVLRIHDSGDFNRLVYFDGWLRVIKENPSILFYAYTKALPFWEKRLDEVSKLPNLVLTASRGGKRDDLIQTLGLREAIVVFSKTEARELKLQIDEDDSHASNPRNRNKSFALLIHGVQPKKGKK